MPLISCPDCGQRVSSNAASCPNCGFPVAKHLASGQIKHRQNKSIIDYVNSPFKVITFGISILSLVMAISNRIQPDPDMQAFLSFLGISFFFGILWLLLNVDTWFQKN